MIFKHKFPSNRFMWMALGFGFGVALAAGMHFAGRKNSGPENETESRHHTVRQNRGKSRSVSDFDARLIAYANRETQRAVERGEVFTEPQPDFHLLDDAGKVSGAALKRAGVPPDKSSEIQMLVDALDARARAGLKERLRRDDRRSDPEHGVVCYKIPADPAAGDAMLFEFRERLAKTVGNDAADLLAKALHPTGRMGWYGKFDIRIKVSGKPPEGDGPETVVQCRYVDPGSGRVLGAWKGTKREFTKRFGIMLDGAEKGDGDHDDK